MLRSEWEYNHREAWPSWSAQAAREKDLRLGHFNTGVFLQNTKTKISVTDGWPPGWASTHCECFLFEEGYSPVKSAPASVSLVTSLKTSLELRSIRELGLEGFHRIQLLTQTSEGLL